MSDPRGAERILRETLSGMRGALGDAHSNTRPAAAHLAWEKRGMRAEAGALRLGANGGRIRQLKAEL